MDLRTEVIQHMYMHAHISAYLKILSHMRTNSRIYVPTNTDLMHARSFTYANIRSDNH